MSKWPSITVFHARPGKQLLALLFAIWFALVSFSVKSEDWENVDELLTAVVGIQAMVPAEARTAAALGTERFGSGVLIDSNGLIVTIGYLILEATAYGVGPNQIVETVRVSTSYGLLYYLKAVFLLMKSGF